MTSVFDSLNPQVEQEEEESKEEGLEDDPQFVAYDHSGNFEEPSAVPESYKYNHIEVPSKEDIQAMARSLGEEQRLVLELFFDRQLEGVPQRYI